MGQIDEVIRMEIAVLGVTPADTKPTLDGKVADKVSANHLSLWKKPKPTIQLPLRG